MKLQKSLISIITVIAIIAAVYLLFPADLLGTGSHTGVEPSGNVNYGQVQVDHGDGGTGKTDNPSVVLVPEDNIDQKQENEHPVYTKADLDNLTNLDHFYYSTIEHIFLGSINASGKASGYHYNGISDSPGEIVPGTESEPDQFGVYTAKVRVNGVKKSGNSGYSSFFPDYMSPQDVIDAINQAYENKVQIEDSLYAGLTDDGMEIDMAINKKGKITTAYPVKEGD